MAKEKPVFTKLARFKHFSNDAANLERKGRYLEASDAWETASKNAPNDLNYQWCVHREAYCKQLHRNSKRG